MHRDLVQDVDGLQFPDDDLGMRAVIVELPNAPWHVRHEHLVGTPLHLKDVQLCRGLLGNRPSDVHEPSRSLAGSGGTRKPCGCLMTRRWMTRRPRAGLGSSRWTSRGDARSTGTCRTKRSGQPAGRLRGLAGVTRLRRVPLWALSAQQGAEKRSISRGFAKRLTPSTVGSRRNSHFTPRRSRGRCVETISSTTPCSATSGW